MFFSDVLLLFFFSIPDPFFMSQQIYQVEDTEQHENF